jgi:hypothetical protein
MHQLQTHPDGFTSGNPVGCKAHQLGPHLFGGDHGADWALGECRVGEGAERYQKWSK